MYEMGGNTCKQCDQQGVNIQNTQRAHTTQNWGGKKKVNASINKWAEDLSRCFSKNTDSQQAHGKMLNIVNY